MPAQVATAMPPAYRKVARTELQLPAGYQAVSTWYQKALRACGFYAPATIPLQRHGGPPYAGLDFTSHDGLSPLTLVFRPLSPQTTAVLYIAQTLDLPPRPTASLLHGPFTRVLVSFQSHGVVSRFNHRYRFTITWQPTIARLVKAINGPAQIWVPLAPGGPVIFYHSAQLSFVRTDGGARKASVGGILDRIIVGHTRPLAAMDGRAIKLVTRIVHRRCHSAGSC